MKAFSEQESFEDRLMTERTAVDDILERGGITLEGSNLHFHSFYGFRLGKAFAELSTNGAQRAPISAQVFPSHVFVHLDHRKPTLPSFPGSPLRIEDAACANDIHVQAFPRTFMEVIFGITMRGCCGWILPICLFSSNF